MASKSPASPGYRPCAVSVLLFFCLSILGCKVELRNATEGIVISGRGDVFTGQPESDLRYDGADVEIKDDSLQLGSHGVGANGLGAAEKADAEQNHSTRQDQQFQETQEGKG